MTLPKRREVHPELLRALLELGGEARPRDVIPVVTDAFPQITREDLGLLRKKGDSLWKNRVQWARQDLAYAGKIASPARGVWALTDTGRAEAEMLGAAALSVAEPPAASYEDDPRDEHDEEEEPAMPEIAILPTDAERIAAELSDAAIDSQAPARLETAVADALSFLGFEAEQIGGSGHTDVFAVAELGVDRYTIVLDAKSTASGKVNDHQIDWDSISDHREQEHADYSCIVGPDFAAGNLRERAGRHATRLLATGQLAQIIRIHAASPLSLKELERLFDASVETTTALRDLETASSERARRRRLPLKLLQIIDSFNRTKPTAVLAKPEPLWGILLHTDDADGKGATLEEVEAALALLETFGILRRSNGEGYVSQTSLPGAKRILETGPPDEPRADGPPEAAGEDAASAI